MRTLWTWTVLEQFAQDTRYALRTMLHNRTFTLMAVVSLALGIGANTAIYSFMDAILLRSLPVSDPESLVVVNWRSKDPRHGSERRDAFVMHAMSGRTDEDSKGGLTGGIFPFPAFEVLRDASGAVLSSMFAYYPARSLNVMVGGQAVRATGEYVSGEYFRGLSVPPAAGRMIGGDDDRPGAPQAAVLSFAFCQRHFGEPLNATGHSIRINNVPFTVVGITPPEFFGVDPAAAPDVYLPMHSNLVVDATGLNKVTAAEYLDQNYYWIEIMGRLRPGIGRAQAEAALAPRFAQWVGSTASNDQERANLPALTLREGAGGLDSLRRQYSKPLAVLLTMVGLILAIACANIANLLLARGAARRREIAVRLSMGAGRLRVVRQLLTESVLLAFAGAGGGALLAVWGVQALTALLANGQDTFTLHAELNWRVLLLTLGISLACGALFGLAPAIQSTRADVLPVLKDTRGGELRTRARHAFLGMNASRALVVSQIGISLLLLVAAGLFARTLSNLQSVPLGFNRDHVLLFNLNARQAGHRDPEIATFYADLRTRLSAIPGVVNVSFSHSSLIGAGRQLPISVSGVDAPGTRILNTGPGFFTTMQIPISIGREIDERDRSGSASVAVVNELFAKRYFPNENPVGRRITLGGQETREMEVIGVCANVRYQGLKGEFHPIVFIPYNQGTFPPMGQMTYAVRTTGDPLRYVKVVRDVAHQADARVPLTDVQTQGDEIARTMNQEIVFARLCTGFAILALVMACVGLYGTMAYTVARRTREIGIRMALGAQRATVTLMVLREVLVMALIGLAISVPAALATSKFVESFLFDLKPNDPRTIAIAVAILISAALLAGYVPARRASRIDPMTALRNE